MSCHEHIVLAPARVLRAETGRALLEVTRLSACKACAERAQCGSQQENPHAQKIWLDTDLPLSYGQTVTVSVAETTVWHAALLAYGLPLAGLIGGLLIGALFSDFAALLSALIGLSIGFIAGGLLAARSCPSPRIQPAPASAMLPSNTAKEKS